MKAHQGLAAVMTRLAELNTDAFRSIGELPPLLIIAPRSATREQFRLEVLPLESIDSDIVRAAIADAFLTVTCLEGYMMEQRRDGTGRFPEPQGIENHPDARRALVYLAQDCTGERACAVQYILRPEHGPAKLSPLKILEDHDVAIADSDLADLTRPGRITPRATH